MFIFIFSVLCFCSVYAQGSNVNFVVVDVEPEELYIGEDEILNITLKNLGTDFATQVEVEIVQNNYITPIGSSIFYTKRAKEAFESEQFFGAVLQEEEIETSFSIHVNDVKPGSYLIPIKVRYKNPNMKTEEKILYIGLKFVGKPKIVLAGINTSPSLIYPDQDFSLQITIENIGKDTAKGVRLELIVPEYFTGENEEFLGSLERDKRATAIFNLKTSKDIKSGLYNFTLIVRYRYDERFIEEKKNFEIYVTEKEKPKLEISSVDISPEKGEKLFPGSSFTLSVQFENIGKQKAKSIKAVLKYPKAFSGEKVSFLGSLEPDDTATAIYDLEVDNSATSGSYTFRVILTYYDEVGNLYRDEKEFSIYVGSKKGESSYSIPLLIAVLLLIYLIYRKVKKRREIEE